MLGFSSIMFLGGRDTLINSISGVIGYLSANPKALEFYDRLGVPRVDEKVYYRLAGEKLKSFADSRRPRQKS